MSKTVAFIGASTGVGLSALKHTLASGHTCIALCRTPSKLSDILPAASTPNLRIIEGNAHDIEAVSKCIKTDDGSLVDAIVSTIGGKPVPSKMMSIDDPQVCGKGMTTLLEAISQLRRSGAAGRPLVICCSTTGLSKFGRDYPLLMTPLYQVMLKVAKADKRVMEDSLADSEEDFVIVRASLLVDGESEKAIRVGVEDPKGGKESSEIGYTISREDAGKWIAKNLVVTREARYVKKIASITY